MNKVNVAVSLSKGGYRIWERGVLGNCYNHLGSNGVQL